MAHNVMLKLILCTAYVHSGKLKVKEMAIYMGLVSACPTDVQTSFLVE